MSKIKKKSLKKVSKDEPKVFAQGLCGTKLFLIFVIGSVLGAYYEEILNFIKCYLADGSLVWSYRRGVLYGPFSPIYGAGAVLMAYFLLKTKRNFLQTILYGGFLGGMFEYVVSFLQETFTGMVSWDYSTHFLNIHGRTTIPFMLVWGLVAWLFVDYLYPFLSRLIEKIPYKIGQGITLFLAIFLVLDMFISWTALIRQTFRRDNIPPYTILGTFYDRVYTDEVLAKHFPNMQVKE